MWSCDYSGLGVGGNMITADNFAFCAFEVSRRALGMHSVKC
jgi:hypothetical protein